MPQLGAKCAACHNEKSWKGAPFDHNTTKFALTGRHDTVKCADCHRDGQYKDTPKTCIGCHRKDDRHKTLFGDKCESCHSTTEWKGYRFNHEEQTRYPLVGKHRAVRCASCHVGNLYRDKLTTACVDCHRKDDKHKGTLGNDCVRCHAERDWKEQAKFSHDRTVFPLLGKHASVQCKDCHLGTMFKDAPTNCVGCHHKDDKHKGTLGESCDKCHNERDWKKTSFDHAKTAYPLLGRHQQAVCGACHKSVNYKEVPKDCYSCHQRDDKHDGQEGRGCASCHDEKGWRPSLRFDHGLARFPLLGKHAQVECRMCHSNALFKNAKSDCQSCHDKDDKHRRSLGSACGQCHNARGWKLWDFNHDVKTKFVLDGSHRGVSCNACHTQPATDRVQMSSQCVACHSKNDAHDGSYGRQCQQCHVTSTFREIRSRQGRPVSSAGPPALLPSRADATRVSAGRNGPMS
jgi:hypothetical protein